jgi:hypothetical protein
MYLSVMPLCLSYFIAFVCHDVLDCSCCCVALFVHLVKHFSLMQSCVGEAIHQVAHAVQERECFRDAEDSTCRIRRYMLFTIYVMGGIGVIELLPSGSTQNLMVALTRSADTHEVDPV